MPDARETSRLQAAQTRDRYLTRQIDRTETFDAADRPSTYRGYDAAPGLHRTERMGHEPTLGATSLTNGGLSDGDPVTQTEGDGAFNAMPQGRRSRRRRRHINGTDTLISALFVGCRDDYPPPIRSYDRTRTLLIWIKDSNKPGCDRYEIPLTFYVGRIGNRVGRIDSEIAFFYYCTPTEKIIQLYFPSMWALKITGEFAIVTTYLDQPDLRADALPRPHDFFTIHLQNGKIKKIEATGLGASYFRNGYYTYSDYWKPYLPYLYKSKTFNPKLLGDDPLHPDDRLTLSPIGKFTLKKPLTHFYSLKNFFGADPVRYGLNNGESSNLDFSVDDLGLTAEERSAVRGTPIALADYLKVTETDSAALLPLDTVASHAFQIRCAIIRGLTT